MVYWQIRDRTLTYRWYQANLQPKIPYLSWFKSTCHFNSTYHRFCFIAVMLKKKLTMIEVQRNELPASIWSSPYPTSRPRCRSLVPSFSPTTSPFSESWLDHGYRIGLQLAQGQWEVWVSETHEGLGVGTWAGVASLDPGTPASRQTQ